MSSSLTCPKCGSKSVSKDRNFAGADTGDRICNECGYESTSNQFRPSKETNNKTNQE